jgi:hypothetical protein
MTDLLRFAYSAENKADFDLDETQATMIDLCQLGYAFTAISASDSGKWWKFVEEMWKNNNHKVFRIVGMTIATGGKIKNKSTAKEDSSVEPKVRTTEMGEDALKSNGINVDLPERMLDLEIKTSKMKEATAKGEIEFKGCCLYSLRFVTIG